MIKITLRLKLTKFTLDDAEDVLRILNDPGFHANIGDRNIRTVEEAKSYLQNSIFPSYATFGFSMFRLALKETDEVIGMCGLLKRDTLDYVDLGYALLQEYSGKGYASEAIEETIRIAREDFKLKTLAAIISPHNDISLHLVEKFGFHFDRLIRINDKEVKLFLKDLY
jgi:RimJ/RimL family protein N-acetyltransferase